MQQHWWKQQAQQVMWWLIGATLVAAALERGGISTQAHLVWTLSLFPLFMTTFFIKKDERSQKIPWILEITGILFLILVIFAWRRGINPDYGFFEIAGYMGGITTWLIVSRIKITEKKEAILENLALFIAGLTTFGLVLYTKTEPDRLFGTFAEMPGLMSNYPNGFALAILTILPFCIWKTITEKKNHTPWTVVTAVLLAGLTLTFSRGAWITACLETGAIIMISRKKWSEKTGRQVILTIIIGGALVMAAQFIRATTFHTNTIEEKITLESQEKNTSTSDRIAFWKGSIKLMKQHPITGYGSGNFAFVYPKYQKDLLANSTHPHNILLKIAVENGLPAALLFLFLVSAILWKGMRSSEEITKIFAIGFGGILVHNLVDYNLNLALNNIIFWLFAGIITASCWQSKTEEKTPSRKSIIAGTLAVTLFFSGIYEIQQRRIIAIGRTARHENRKKEALELFQRAEPIFRQNLDDMIAEARGDKKSETDKKNWLSSYLRNQENINFQEIKKVLEEYEKLLRKNAYNTIDSSNPYAAIMLARTLKMTDLEKKLQQEASIERKKFTNNFAKILPIPLTKNL